ncbi:MAG TPA: DUF3418 domain-containing protein, partial [Methylothermaceae bacterium]|nr:DUF3418 domain-containing protein [Methylothermaceae bacterium]
RLGRTIADILKLLQTCRSRRGELKHLDQSPSGADIDRQLALLGYQGFVGRIPLAYLQHLPRYLKALQYRLDKAEYELARDEARVAKIQPFWDAYWQRVAAGDIADPDADLFRWSLEEFRVSLFAQQIRTAYPISEKRLAKAWADYQAA